ncbi:hypothetical protein D3C59_27320 [Streptomyces sp. SHP22-7]|nr:hypothetical protein D3C59_27320 [Streptomyces sp. SHP22-7]
MHRDQTLGERAEPGRACGGILREALPQYVHHLVRHPLDRARRPGPGVCLEGGTRGGPVPHRRPAQEHLEHGDRQDHTSVAEVSPDGDRACSGEQ